MRNLIAIAVAAALAGCGSPQQPAPQGPLPSATEPPAREAPKRQISKADRESFASAAKKYAKYAAEAKKDGGWTKGHCKGAAEAFKDVGSDHPKIAPDCYANAGAAYEHCGMIAEATDAYDEANRKARAVIQRDYAPALVGLGRIAYQKGELEKAEDLFRKAIAADPKNAEARNAFAVVLYEKGRKGAGSTAFNEGIVHLRNALAIDSANMTAYTTLALIYYEIARDDRSKLDLAALVCKQAKDVSKTHAPIYNISGLIWLKKKNVTRALEDFRKAVELDDALLEAHMNIGAITLSYRDYPSAMRAFQKVLARRQNDVEAMVGLAVALRGEKKMDEAEALYKKIAAVDPKNPAVPFNLGLLYQDYKDSQEPTLLKAKAFFSDFLARGGAADKVTEAKRRIKNIDDIIAANKEAAALQRDAERLQKQQEEQDRKAKEDEERQKKQDAAKPAAAKDAKAPAAKDAKPAK
ncbi:MAG TPA: tetratricopeptide repeat protein [Polyangia bacterium]|jgi:tetratricopeptide (TPR) repeat protein